MPVPPSRLIRTLVAGGLALVVAAAAALAARELTPAERALREAPTTAALRERLLDLAGAGTEAGARYDAGEAAYWAGVSYARAGERDSALLCLELAVARRAGREEILALADELLARRAGDDALRAEALLGVAFESAALESPARRAGLQGRLAWSLALQGLADSAATLFAPVEDALADGFEWRYRMGKVALETGDPRRAFRHLFPVVLASRRADRDASLLLEQAAEAMGVDRRLEAEIVQALAARDRIEAALVDSLGGRRVRFPAVDGTGLGGVLVPATGAARPRSAVVYRVPGDTLASYDSLVVTLRRAGFATLILDPRGSGWSVSLECPLPDAWRGREDVMRERCALDLGPALARLAEDAGADTTAALVVGVGPTASLAIEAARLDRRVAALVLVSPTPAPPEYPALRAALATRDLPVYFQIAPEDYVATWEITDLLHRSAKAGRSVVGDSKRQGRFAAQFRHDPAIASRLTAWLAAAVPPSPPRRPPRGG